MLRIRIALSVLLLIGWFALFNNCLDWISAPSNASLYGGISALLGSMIVMPMLFTFLWKRSNKKHDSQA